MRGFRRMPPHKPFGFMWGHALFTSSSPAWTLASCPGRDARQTDLDKTIGIYQESEKVLSEDLPVIPYVAYERGRSLCEGCTCRLLLHGST